MMRPLLEGLECVDEVWFLTDEDALDTVTARMREAGVDTVVHLQPNPVVEEAAARAEIPQRMGFAKDGAQWLTHSLPYPKKQGTRHESRYAFELFAMLGVPEPSGELFPALRPDPDAPSRLQGKWQDAPAAYGVLHLGVYGAKPRVPTDYFAAVAELYREYSCATVLVGEHESEPELPPFFEAVRGKELDVHNLYGRLDLAELACVLGGARAYFSRDTGPAHLAAAMGCPTVTWFLQPNPVMHPRRWKPLGAHSFVLCAPVRQRSWEDEHAFARRSLKRIGVEEVVGKVREALEVER